VVAWQTSRPSASRHGGCMNPTEVSDHSQCRDVSFVIRCLLKSACWSCCQVILDTLLKERGECTLEYIR
jgi:hypothetical protein